MYIEGNILYFTPFYFKNGHPCKPKYFIVLKVLESKTVVASLPTRKDSIPEKDVVDAGCVELPEIGLNCFIISDKKVITKCNKVFDFKTHIYGHQLDTHELKEMRDMYRIEGSDYEIFGEMIPEIFQDLLQCLKASKSVKNKYLKALE